MKHTFFLFGILVFFSLTLFNSGITNIIMFAFFWLFVLGTLISLMSLKRWVPVDWLVFATFATSTIIGVFYSTKTFNDLVAIVIPFIGLLLVSIFLSILPRKNQEKKTRKAKVLFVAPKTGKKYHRINCRLLKTKNLEVYESREAAEYAGLSPCKICLSE